MFLQQLHARTMTVWKLDEARTKVRQTPGPESMTTPVVRPSVTRGRQATNRTARDTHAARDCIVARNRMWLGSRVTQTAGGSRWQVARDRRRFTTDGSRSHELYPLAHWRRRDQTALTVQSNGVSQHGTAE